MVSDVICRSGGSEWVKILRYTTKTTTNKEKTKKTNEHNYIYI